MSRDERRIQVHPTIPKPPSKHLQPLAKSAVMAALIGLPQRHTTSSVKDDCPLTMRINSTLTAVGRRDSQPLSRVRMAKVQLAMGPPGKDSTSFRPP